MPLPDLDKPLADRGKEALRLMLKRAEADLEWNASGIDLSFELTDTLFALATDVLAAVAALQAARDEFQATVTAMNARLVAVETALAAYDPPAPEEPATDA